MPPLQSLIPRFTLLILALFAALGCGACASQDNPAAAPGLALADFPSANLILRNPAGKIVLIGEFTWPAAPLAKGQNFTGIWHPLATTKEVPAAWQPDENGRVKYHFEYASEAASINLTFPKENDNLFLLAPLANGQFSGPWFYTTLKGTKSLGTFELRTTAP